MAHVYTVCVTIFSTEDLITELHALIQAACSYVYMHSSFEWRARETYSKVDGGKAIENDKDVLVTQFDKAEVETSCGKREGTHKFESMLVSHGRFFMSYCRVPYLQLQAYHMTSSHACI